MCLSVDALVVCYNIVESLSCAVSMIICNISISDISFFQFVGEILRLASLSMVADLTISYHFSLGLPTLLNPAHTLFTIGLD